MYPVKCYFVSLVTVSGYVCSYFQFTESSRAGEVCLLIYLHALAQHSALHILHICFIKELVFELLSK